MSEIDIQARLVTCLFFLTYHQTIQKLMCFCLFFHLKLVVSDFVVLQKCALKNCSFGFSLELMFLGGGHSTMLTIDQLMQIAMKTNPQNYKFLDFF